MKTVWPLKIFEEHPYVLNERGITKSAGITYIFSFLNINTYQYSLKTSPNHKVEHEKNDFVCCTYVAM